MELKPLKNISSSEESIQCPECDVGLLIFRHVNMTGDIVNCLLCHQPFVIRSLVGNKKRRRSKR